MPATDAESHAGTRPHANAGHEAHGGHDHGGHAGHDTRTPATTRRCSGGGSG